MEKVLVGKDWDVVASRLPERADPLSAEDPDEAFVKLEKEGNANDASHHVVQGQVQLQLEGFRTLKKHVYYMHVNHGCHNPLQPGRTT